MRGNIIKDLLINFLTIITLHCKNNATVVGLLIGSYASPMHTVCAEQHGLVAAEGCTDVPCLTNNTDSRFIYMSMHQTHTAELQGKKRALAVSRVLIGNYSHSRGSDRECGGGGRLPERRAALFPFDCGERLTFLSGLSVYTERNSADDYLFLRADLVCFLCE